MIYSETLLHHFYEPYHVGTFAENDCTVGRAVIGSYQNGVLIHLYIQVDDNIITTARFKAYGNVPTLAACSYVVQWLEGKTLNQAKSLQAAHIIQALSIPELKKHAALLVEDAVKAAINHYESIAANL